MNEILIVGCGTGKMGRELERITKATPGFEFMSFDSNYKKLLETDLYHTGMWDGRHVVAIHFGSGSRLDDLVTFCTNGAVPLLQCSTQGPKMPELPTQPNFALVIAPNSALPIVRLFAALPSLAKVFEGMKVEITHSHQKEKTTMPGTAKRFAEAFGVDPALIKTPTNDTQRMNFGVAHKHLGWHGHHRVTAIDPSGAVIEIWTRINGGEDYALGALDIARRIAHSGMQLMGVYKVEQILEMTSAERQMA